MLWTLLIPLLISLLILWTIIQTGEDVLIRFKASTKTNSLGLTSWQVSVPSCGQGCISYVGKICLLLQLHCGIFNFLVCAVIEINIVIFLTFFFNLILVYCMFLFLQVLSINICFCFAATENILYHFIK